MHSGLKSPLTYSLVEENRTIVVFSSFLFMFTYGIEAISVISSLIEVVF